MNPDTLVAVSCYSGDISRVENALSVGLYLHHECPVVLLSPADAPVEIRHPQVVCQSAGVRGVEGQSSLDRWDLYFRKLLEFPQKNFLICDSDSFCLSPELPARFYKHPEVFWSYHHLDERLHASEYQKVAFQSPMFFNRETLEKMMEVDRAKVPCHPITPYQDWYLVALACEAGITCRHNQDAVSYMGWNGGGENSVVGGIHTGPEWRGADQMVFDVLHGKILIHSVRHLDVLKRVVEARQGYVWRIREARAAHSNWRKDTGKTAKLLDCDCVACSTGRDIARETELGG